MCFSPEASFTAAAILVPAGLAAITRAYRTDRRYLPISVLPILLGIQQAVEGIIWVSGGDPDRVKFLSLAYMFFTWLAWPVWTPLSLYFLEPARRKPVFVVFAILGGVLGSAQYFPYFAHDNWLVTKFLAHSISYQGNELFDYIIGRPATYILYVSFVVGPLLLSSHLHIRIFGLLVFSVLVITYIFFAYAYISVFCYGGGLMSLYLVWMIFSNGGASVSTVQSR